MRLRAPGCLYASYATSSVLGIGKKRSTELEYASTLRQCHELYQVKQVHSQLRKCGCDREKFLGNLLIQMYGKCRSVENAQRVFDEIEKPNAFSWNIMVAAYAENGHLWNARSMFNRMPQWSVVSCNGMVVSYARSGHLEEAKTMFEEMPDRNVVSWTVMVTAYAKEGHLQEAKNLFDRMPERNVVSWTAMLAAYAQTAHLEEASEIFRRIPQMDLVSCNAMLTAYAQNGHLVEARKMFEEMPEQNGISWTAIVGGCAQNGFASEAFRLFRKMLLDGLKPESFGFIGVLDACTSPTALAEGKAIHALVIESGLESDVFLHTSLINMYGKCSSVANARSLFDKVPQNDVVLWTAMLYAYTSNGYLEEAKRMFDKMPLRDVVAWNCMIAAYGQNGENKKARKLFHEMNLGGVPPNKTTFASILDTCSTLAEGKIIHGNIADSGFLPDVLVETTVVAMYGKCGALNDARRVFEEMPQRNVVAWNAMVGVYAQKGHTEEALSMFKSMDLEGMPPNEITFVNLFTALCGGGLLEDGLKYFISMDVDYGVVPSVHHFACMVDLLGRAGKLGEAEDLINNMPFEPDSVAWTSFLGACRIHGEKERGGHAAKRVYELEPGNSAPYILLSSICAGSNQ